MASFVFPTSAELHSIEMNYLAVLTYDDPIFKILPIQYMDADVIAFEQEDDYIGLQTMRGINGAPGNVTPVGIKRYTIKPGVYGEYISISETELVKRRQAGSVFKLVSVKDLIRKRQELLLHRRINRIRQICWNLLTTGTFSVSNASGSVTHTDTFSPQVFNAYYRHPWGDKDNATPLVDIRNAAISYRGFSVQFNEKDKIYLNKKTFNNLLFNWNFDDLFGHRLRGQGMIQNVRELNRVLTGMGLPNAVVYDHTYDDMNPINAITTKSHLDQNNNVIIDGYTHTFIPDDIAVMVGHRNDDKPIGAYKITRNANTPDSKPGCYVKVEDSLKTGGAPPRSIQVHDGHNGAVTLNFPSSFVIMNVGLRANPP